MCLCNPHDKIRMARLWRNPKIKMGILIAGAALALVLLIVIMYYAICYRGPAKMDFDVRSNSKLTVLSSVVPHLCASLLFSPSLYLMRTAVGPTPSPLSSCLSLHSFPSLTLPSFSTPITRFTLHTPHSLHPAIRFAPCPTATPPYSQGRTSTCMERAYLKARTRDS